MNRPTPRDLSNQHNAVDALSQSPQQQCLFDVGVHSKATRAISYANAIEKGASRRARIFEFVRSQDAHGGTRQEIADALELPIQSVCGPVLALLRSGRLIETPSRRDTKHGKPAVVIVAASMKVAS